MLQEIEKMKGRDFVQQLLDGTVLNEKGKIVAQVTSELEKQTATGENSPVAVFRNNLTCMTLEMYYKIECLSFFVNAYHIGQVLDDNQFDTDHLLPSGLSIISTCT